MNHAGSFGLFAEAFPTDLLPAVFALILEEWPRSPRPDEKPIENRISNRFVGHLNNAMRKKLPHHAAVLMDYFVNGFSTDA